VSDYVAQVVKPNWEDARPITLGDLAGDTGGIAHAHWDPHNAFVTNNAHSFAVVADHPLGRGWVVDVDCLHRLQPS